MSAMILPNVRPGPRARIIAVGVGAIVMLGALFNGVVGALSLLNPRGFLALVGEGNQALSPGAFVFAGYAGSRELAIAAALLVLLAARATPALVGVLMVAALANAIDVVGAVLAGRLLQLPGALIFTIAYAAAAIWFSRNQHMSFCASSA